MHRYGLLISTLVLHLSPTVRSRSPINDHRHSKPTAFETLAPVFTPPTEFTFACGSSAYQVEGFPNVEGKSPSIWDTFVHSNPSPVARGETGDEAMGMYSTEVYDRDFRLYRDAIGVQAYDFTLSWTRILPNGRGPVNEAGIKHYSDMINNLHAKGLKAICTLYHWDLPQTLQDSYGGWADRKIVEDFALYARTVFESPLGKQCDGWYTFNEPRTFCFEGYSPWSPLAPAPAWASWSSSHACVHYAILAHLRAMEIYRSLGLPSPIGIKVDGQTAVPYDPLSVSDQTASTRAMNQTYGHVLEPLMLSGDYPASMVEDYGATGTGWLPVFTEEEKVRLRNSMLKPDILGLDLYTTLYASAVPDCFRGSNDAWPSCVRFDIWNKMGEIIGASSQSSWNFDYPHTVRVALNHVFKAYVEPSNGVQLITGRAPTSLVVSENGVAVRGEADKPLSEIVQDDERVAWFTHTLTSIKEAIEIDRIPVTGFAAWSCIDNFEWADGYASRFGLIHVDRETQVRTPKKSASFLKNVFAKKQ